jgi:hypothetical protein
MRLQNQAFLLFILCRFGSGSSLLRRPPSPSSLINLAHRARCKECKRLASLKAKWKYEDPEGNPSHISEGNNKGLGGNTPDGPSGTEDRNYSSFGVLEPIARLIDEKSGDWGLSYADLTPYHEFSPEGVAFLGTNLFYVWAGYSLLQDENYLLGLIIEIAGICSLNYHWAQLHYGPNRDEVRSALLLDYIVACTAILTTFVEIVQLVSQYALAQTVYDALPLNSVIYGAIGFLCLFGSWSMEYGLPYMISHGLWHVFSALSAADVSASLHELSQAVEGKSVAHAPLLHVDAISDMVTRVLLEYPAIYVHILSSSIL